MTMTTAVIIDDEKKSREVLIQLIENIDLKVSVLGQASSVEEGVTLINEKKPQLVFLDVEMLDGTGFNLLDKFDTIDFEVVFTTAYDHYAVKAFKYSAIDYLLKPINIDELEETIHRTKNSISKKQTISLQISTLLSNIKNESNNKRIAIKSADRIDFVEVNEILYCTSDSSYTEIALTKDRNRNCGSFRRDRDRGF